MSVTASGRDSALAKTPRRLTIWAGYLLAAIGVLHVLVFIPHPYWGQWLSGGLWNGGAADESVAVFWALPGGFAPLLIIFGFSTAGAARRGTSAPGYAAWGILAWVVACIALIGMSGFVFGLIPAILLVAADITARRNRRSHQATPH